MSRNLGVKANDSGKFYFISYNTEDEERVSRYVKLMEKNGLPMWYDYGIKVGREWEEDIAEHIRRSEAVILFVSKNIFHKQKSYVHKEYEMAIDYFSTPVYVVMLDEIQKSEIPSRYVSWWIDVCRLQSILAFQCGTEEDCVEKILSAISGDGKGEELPLKEDIDFKINKTEDADLDWLFKRSEISEPSQKMQVEKGKGIPLNLLGGKLTSKSEQEKFAQQLLNIFKNDFNIDIIISEIKQGPLFYRYYLTSSTQNFEKKIFELEEDLTFLLFQEGVRIVKDTDGKIFVEIPKSNREVVSVKEVLESDLFLKKNDDNLLFVLGQDSEGNPVVEDLCSTPHVLLSGASGSGLSVFINSLLLSFMMKYTPEDVRFLLIDTKTVEFDEYVKSPHLLVNEILKSPEMIFATLKWLISEVEFRLNLFEQYSVENVNAYNKKSKANGGEKLYKIVVVIDEFSDLLISNQYSFISSLKSLLKDADKAGIHVVLKTQQPREVERIDELAKLLPTRICFKTYSRSDSEFVLGQTGAESLLPKGDMLYKKSLESNAIRVQSAFVSGNEVKAVADYTAEYYEPKNEDYLLYRIKSFITDPTEEMALEILKAKQMLSVQILQDELGLEFYRAIRILEKFKSEGYITQSVENKLVYLPIRRNA